jgi:hypothetical protein
MTVAKQWMYPRSTIGYRVTVHGDQSSGFRKRLLNLYVTGYENDLPGILAKFGMTYGIDIDFIEVSRIEKNLKKLLKRELRKRYWK